MVLLETSNQFTSQYDICEELGKGTFSIVKKCKNKSNQKEYAAKIIYTKEMNERDALKLDNENRICLRLKHSNIIQLYESISTLDFHYFVFDLATVGELFDEIVTREYFSEYDASHCMSQILGAIEYCHSIGIVHRDIKPENLLLFAKQPDLYLKIADFGLAIEVNDNEKKFYGMAGTPIYLSPEVLKNESYGKPVDLWSSGIILYILLGGDLPFWDQEQLSLYAKIKTGSHNYSAPEWQRVSFDAKNLIDQLLCSDQERRLKASQALQHPWIVNRNRNLPFEPKLDAVKLLKVFNARRKLKSVVFTAIAANRLANNN